MRWCALGGLEPTLSVYSREYCNYIFQCYLQSLCQNETIKHKVVKTECIKQDIKAAKTFSAATNIQDPTITPQGESDKIFKLILDEHKKWDEVMNKREPVSEEMFAYIISSQGTNSTSKSCAVADWLTIGRQAGLRISEYGQEEATLSKTGTFATNDYGDPVAFTLDDFVFYGRGRQNIYYDRTTRLNLDLVVSAKIRWRTQKNKEREECIWYARNDADPSRCVIRAMLRIRARAQDLTVPVGFPIAVYRDEKGARKFITNNIMAKTFQDAARTAHKITDEKELKRYSSHSVRVMACVLLFAKGKSTDFIKYRLRWKSDCFQMYLRHVPTQAHEHNEATTDCSFYL